VAGEFQVDGQNDAAPFTLKVHRGEGMALLAMNWRDGQPPDDFVGFAIEYREPGGTKFFALKNRVAFPGTGGATDPSRLSTKLSPIQKFRWVHFPRNAELEREFHYRVTPMFMNAADELSEGVAQEAAIELRRETYPKKLNVAFTRGFVSSQAFVDRFGGTGAIKTLLPATADKGLNFAPTHPKAEEALAWMGFEARSAILEVLDQAVADKTAEVFAVVYDLNEPGMVSRFQELGKRLKIIIDDDGAHGKPKSAESRAAALLAQSAGADHVKRQHLGKLQHNKTIVVDGEVQACVCGSTNHSWRGFFVQNNNAIILRGKSAVKIFRAAAEAYWANDDVAGFSLTGSAVWNDLGLKGIDAQIGFSPRSKQNAVLDAIAKDLAENTTSSLLFSLAFLYQTPGAIQKAVKKIQKDKKVFSYGISDHAVKGLEELAEGEEPEVDGVELKKPDGTVTVVGSAALTANVPEPFKSEPTGGGGTRMHHKFIVIDFDKPTARVYMGSYNFSVAADISNGENLLLIKDRRIAVSYAVEAVRLFDHYHFRVAQLEAKAANNSTTTTSVWPNWKRKRPTRGCSSPGRPASGAKSPGGRNITRTPGRFATASCSPRRRRPSTGVSLVSAGSPQEALLPARGRPSAEAFGRSVRVPAAAALQRLGTGRLGRGSASTRTRSQPQGSPGPARSRRSLLVICPAVRQTWASCGRHRPSATSRRSESVALSWDSAGDSGGRGSVRAPSRWRLGRSLALPKNPTARVGRDAPGRLRHSPDATARVPPGGGGSIRRSVPWKRRRSGPGWSSRKPGACPGSSPTSTTRPRPTW
jgi:phosphatidylserine/phosphatidylglycerophosphate/cardiolipin synthase-like enzyme